MMPVAAFLLAFGLASLASPGPAPEPSPGAVSPRGLASSIMIDPKGPPLLARPIAADERPPVVVRVDPPDASGRQRVEYIGLVAGDHDLRAFLMRADGAAPTGVEPLPVRIESRLEPGHATDVLGLAEPNLTYSRGYVAALSGLAAAWALVPLAAYVRRRMQRPVITPPPPPTPEPTLAERLLAMLDSWEASGRSVDQRAALELLALHHQRSTVAERDEAIATAMIKARGDDRTRETVLALEAWLHARASDPAAAEAAAMTRLREIAGRAATREGGRDA